MKQHPQSEHHKVNYCQMGSAFVDTFVAVAKIVVAVAGAAAASKHIPRAKETLKDFGFVITNVLLPCLFLSHMLESVNAEMVRQSAVLVVFSITAIVSGYLLAKVAGRLLFPLTVRYTTDEAPVDVRLTSEGGSTWVDIRHGADVPAAVVLAALRPPTEEAIRADGYRVCLTVATMIQNTFVLPISLVSSLATMDVSRRSTLHRDGADDGASGSSLSWIDIKLVTAYIFFFNVMTTLAFWTVGPVMVRSAARRRARACAIRDLLDRHLRFASSVSRATQTGDDAPSPGELVCTARSPYVHLRSSAASDGADEGPRRPRSTPWQRAQASLAPLLNAPLMATLVGLVLGLTPPLRDLFLTGPLRVLQDVALLVGDGTVPASLFLLGCNLATDFSMVTERADRLRSAGTSAADDDSDDEHPPSPQCCDSFTQGNNSGTSRLACFVANEAAKETSAAPAPTQAALPTARSVALAINSADMSIIQPGTRPTGASSPLQLFALGDLSPKLIVGMVLLRLVLLPAFLFGLVHLAVRSGRIESIADPCHNPLLLTLLVELFAPSAINTALLFNLQHFMVAEFSKALLYQYSASVITLMLWLTVTTNYVAGGECAQ